MFKSIINNINTNPYPNLIPIYEYKPLSKPDTNISKRTPQTQQSLEHNN